MKEPRLPEFDQDTWHNAGDVAHTLLSDIAIREKDRADEKLDAKRVHGGQTLDEFLASK